MKKILLLVISFLFLFSVDVYANDKKKIINYSFNKELKATGVSNDHNFYFDIDEMWEVSDSYINLVFTQSPLTIGEKSSLTLSINDTPIYSIKLIDKMKYNEQIKVPINKEHLKIGSNKLTISTTRRISDLPCEDDINKGNWIYFSEDSYVHIQYNDLNDYNKISTFPKKYSFENNNFIKSNIYISNNSSDKEIEAAINLSSYIGSYYKNINSKISLEYFNSKNIEDDENFIFISSYKNLPIDFKKYLNENDIKIAEKFSLIKNININNKYIMLITGKEEALINSIKFLSNKNLVKQVEDNYIYIYEGFKYCKYIESSNENSISLKELGYSDNLMRGPFIQKSYYHFNLESDKKLSDESYFDLKFRYSKNIDYDRSLVTTYINGIPIGSKNLTIENSDNDSLKLKIPNELLNENSFNIEVEFDLAIKGSYCDPRGSDTPWAFISQDSTLEISPIKREVAKLNYLPYPFIEEGGINNTVIVIPDFKNSNYLTMASNISAYFGKFIKDNSNEIKIITPDKYNSINKEENFIILGTPFDNQIIKQLNNTLNIKYNDEFNNLISEDNNEIKFIPNYARKISLAQIIEDNKLIISSLDFNNLTNIVNLVTDINKYNLLDGDAITVDSKQDFKLFNFNNEEKNKKDATNKKLILNNKSVNQIIIVILFMIVIIASIILIIITNKRKE